MQKSITNKGGLNLILKRSTAYILDIVILFVVLAPVGFFIQWLVGIPMPETGPELARTILWNFSIPSWLYFILSDSSPRGATLGKRLLKLQVIRTNQERVPFFSAVWRTAVKLLPWELVHIFGFALSVDFTQVTATQTSGMILANLLLVVYVILFIVSRGRRSVHDYVVQTEVVME